MSLMTETELRRLPGAYGCTTGGEVGKLFPPSDAMEFCPVRVEVRGRPSSAREGATRPDSRLLACACGLRVGVFVGVAVPAEPDPPILHTTRPAVVVETPVEAGVRLPPGVVERRELHLGRSRVDGAVAGGQRDVDAVAPAERKAFARARRVSGVPRVEELF